MTSRLQTIREICQVLIFYANRLDHLRGTIDRTRAVPAEATYLSAASGYAGIGPWYRIIEPVYEELDQHIRSASKADCAAVFDDEWILANEPKLHHIRACYEFDKEYDQAQAILDAVEPAAVLEKMVSDQVFWTVTPELREVLAGASHVIVAGSGPLPVTALAIASTLKLRVTSVERDKAANKIARRLIAISGHAHLIDTVGDEIGAVGALDKYDAVVGAVLLGVGVDDCAVVPKNELVKRILSHAGPDVPFAMRDPYELGRLYYPTASLDISTEFDVQRIDPDRGPDLPYRSSLLLIRTAQPDENHAHSSAAAVCS